LTLFQPRVLAWPLALIAGWSANSLMCKYIGGRRAGTADARREAPRGHSDPGKAKL